MYELPQVVQEGIEPPTRSFSDSSSTGLSYRTITLIYYTLFSLSVKSIFLFSPRFNKIFGYICSHSSRLKLRNRWRFCLMPYILNTYMSVIRSAAVRSIVLSMTLLYPFAQRCQGLFGENFCSTNLHKKRRKSSFSPYVYIYLP